MGVIRMTEVEGTINQRGILSTPLVNHEHLSIHNLVLKPGESIPPHRMPVDVTFYVVAGQGTIFIGDTENPVIPGDIVQCPIETTMSVAAAEEEGLSVLNMKTPSIKNPSS